MGEHNNRSVPPPAPKQIQLSFKSPVEITVYMILDRLTSDAQLCEHHLTFLANAGIPIDQNLIKAQAEIKNKCIINRDNYYRSISGGLVLPFG